MISLIKCYLFAANISSSMVFNGCPRLMVVCTICRMCTQLAMIHFSKEKLFFISQQKLLHNKLNIQRCCCFNWTKLFSRVGWLVNDLVRLQTNIYANTSNAAISDPALPTLCSNRFGENWKWKNICHHIARKSSKKYFLKIKVAT